MIHLEDVDDYDELGYKWVTALCTKLGGLENVKGILRDELIVEIGRANPRFFDKNGRRIPPRSIQNAVCDPDTNFKLNQPEIDYAGVINRLQRSFPSVMGNGRFLSAEDFKQKAEALLEQLRQDEFLANLTKGVWLPVCFPHLRIENYGQSLEEVFLPAVEVSYRNQFPNRSFENYRKGDLAASVTIVEGSRHEILLSRMEQGPVVGIMFFPLQGFSVLAQREQMASLPSSLLLAGAVDMATAMAAYPDVLARDWNTPGYDCSAVKFRSSAASLSFGAHVDDLKFDYYEVLANADGYYSGGLVFVG